MNPWLAKLLYVQSIGDDMSEWPVAGARHHKRKALLRKRIGNEEADRFIESRRDESIMLGIAACAISPVFWFVFAIGIGFFLMLAGPGLWR